MNINFLNKQNVNYIKNNILIIKKPSFVNFTGEGDTFKKNQNNSERPSFKLDDIKNPRKRKLALDALDIAPVGVLQVNEGQKLFFDEYAISKIRSQVVTRGKNQQEADNTRCSQNESFGLSYALDSNEIKQLIFEQHNKRNPNVGFLYNPSLKPAEKNKILTEKKEIVSVVNLGKQYTPMVNVWAENGVLDYETYKNRKYIDISFPSNKKFLDDFEEKRKGAPRFADVAKEYCIYESWARNLLKNGKFDFIGLKGSDYRMSINENFPKDEWPVDMESENTKATLEKCLKTLSVADKKYFKGSKFSTKVPTSVLRDLGFNRTDEHFKFLIQKGIIKGGIVYSDNKENDLITVNINDERTEEQLKELRKSSSKVIGIRSLAKRLGMTVQECKDYIIENNYKVIKNYIFPSDQGKLYIDLSREENISLLQKLENNNSNA